MAVTNDHNPSTRLLVCDESPQPEDIDTHTHTHTHTHTQPQTPTITTPQTTAASTSCKLASLCTHRIALPATHGDEGGDSNDDQPGNNRHTHERRDLDSADSSLPPCFPAAVVFCVEWRRSFHVRLLCWGLAGVYWRCLQFYRFTVLSRVGCNCSYWCQRRRLCYCCGYRRRWR